MPEEVSAEAGYYSAKAVEGLSALGVDPFIAPDKTRHGQTIPPAPRGRIPANLSARDRMRRKLRTKRGRQRYGLRKETVEPVFGQIKQGRGFRQFLLRGLEKVNREWSLICTGHNLLKLFRLRVRVRVSRPEETPVLGPEPPTPSNLAHAQVMGMPPPEEDKTGDRQLVQAPSEPISHSSDGLLVLQRRVIWGGNSCSRILRLLIDWRKPPTKKGP